MNWSSPAEFFAMGGYGMYVWGSLIVTIAAVCLEYVGLRRQRQQTLSNLQHQFSTDEKVH